MDAHYVLQKNRLILCSRGGSIGSASARNTQYGPALRKLLERTDQSALNISEILVDSSKVRHLPNEDRAIFFSEDANLSLGELFTTLANRMKSIGSNSENPAKHGNSTRRLCFEFSGTPSVEQLVRTVGWGVMEAASNPLARLSPRELKSVQAYHIFNAVQGLCSGSVKHHFGQSNKYELIAEDGSRLAPNAVFGLAATSALGYDVKPHHFKNGKRTTCFKVIVENGFEVVSNGESASTNNTLLTADDRLWCEGGQKRVAHLERERRPEVARAKKREFISIHGKLLCERCGLDPAKIYESRFGEACIEVHHKIPLSEMPKGYKTRLQDLMCVCANCHRFIHRQLRNSKQDN